MRDFTGFTFNGIHTDDLGIVRVSGGDRYNETLLPEFEDKTADIPGNDGTYYFGSYFKNKSLKLSIAFDHLTEEQFRKLRQTFGGKGIYPLIFDEKPYKQFMVKLASTPEINYVCFDEQKRTVGTGTNGVRVIQRDPSFVRETVYPYVYHYEQVLEISSSNNEVVPKVNKTTFLGQLPDSGTYNFVYSISSSGWVYDESVVSLGTYGISYTWSSQDHESLSNGDTITVKSITQEEKERIYKGEMDIEFIAYYPFARAPQKVYSIDNNSRNYYQVGTCQYYNVDEWREASGLKSMEELEGYDYGGGPLHTNYDYTIHATKIPVFNPGDVSTPASILTGFELMDNTSRRIPGLSFSLVDSRDNILGTLVVDSITENIGENWGYFINSRNHLIEQTNNMSITTNANYIKTDKIYNDKIESGDFFNIPAGFDGYIICKNISDVSESNPDPSTGRWYRIVYDYLYY